MKDAPDEELLAIKKEQLTLLEHQSQTGAIDLFYGDKSGLSELYVPYAWQFKDENIGIKATHGQQLNCFGLLSRTNELLFKTIEKAINTEFVLCFLEKLAFPTKKQTVVVLIIQGFILSINSKNA